MAAGPMLWAWKIAPLLENDAQRVVLLHLSWRANEDGLLWPTVNDIALELGKSQRAIRRAIKELHEVVTANADFGDDGSQGANWYQLLTSISPQELIEGRKKRRAGHIM
jgi:hypothetical protein